MTAAALRNFYTTGDVAKMLKVSKRNIQNWSEAKKIPGRRDPMSNYWVYTQKDIKQINEIIVGTLQKKAGKLIEKCKVIDRFGQLKNKKKLSTQEAKEYSELSRKMHQYTRSMRPRVRGTKLRRES